MAPVRGKRGMVNRAVLSRVFRSDERDSACATSVRVTSPALRRSRVCFNCSVSTSTLRRLIEDRLVAQQFHIGGSGVEKYLLLGDTQRLARPRHLAFCLARAIGGLKSVEQRLRRDRAELPGTKRFADAVVDDSIWKHLLVDGFVELAKVIIAAGCSDAEFRSIT